MGRFPAACDHSIGPSRTLSVPSPPHSHSPSALLGAEVARDADGDDGREVSSGAGPGVTFGVEDGRHEGRLLPLILLRPAMRIGPPLGDLSIY